MQAGGGIGRTTDRERGCHGELLSEEVHDQRHAAVESRRTFEEGAVFGGGIGYLRGKLVSSRVAEMDPALSPYVLGMVRTFTGFDRQRMGGVFGVAAYVSDSGDVRVVPNVELRFGDPDDVFTELALLKPVDGFDLRLLQVSLGVSIASATLRVGFGSGSRMIVDQEVEDFPVEDRLHFVDLDGDGTISDGIFFTSDLTLPVWGAGSFVVGGTFGERFGLRLGLEIDLPDEAPQGLSSEPR